MKETFRVSPTVPGVMRVLPEDTVLCDYQVPAGTAVFANSLIACRNEVSSRTFLNSHRSHVKYLVLSENPGVFLVGI